MSPKTRKRTAFTVSPTFFQPALTSVPPTELCPERHNAPGPMKRRVSKLTTVQANPTPHRPNPDLPTLSDDALGALKLAWRWSRCRIECGTRHLGTRRAAGR